MSERKSLTDHALDAVLYLPVGALLTARDELPKIAVKGKAYVTSNVTMAKAVGNMAVTFGGREAEKRFHDMVRKVGALWGEKPVGEAPSATAPAGSGDSAESGTSPNSSAAASPPSAVPSVNGNGSGTLASAGADIAIPGYDTLSASQVIQRLDGLSPAEVEAVLDYESATRDRKTIVNRAHQLLSAAGNS